MKKLSGNQNQSSFYILLIMTVGLVLFGWYNVYAQYWSLRNATIASIQAAEQQIVEATANAAQVYWRDQLRNLNVTSNTITNSQIRDIEEKFFTDYISKIHLLVDEGDAWVIGYNNEMVFDKSVDFPYFGITIDKFLPMQAASPSRASHYEQMVSDVLARRENTGWYIWDQNKGCKWDGSYKPGVTDITKVDCGNVKEIGGYTWEKGIEIGAWTPAVVDDTHNIKWMIGLTTPLTAIMDQSGARKSVNESILFMAIVTIVIAVVFYNFVIGQRRVQALQKEVAQLKIEIDAAKKQQEVSKIVESEYFQSLKERAAEIRARADSKRRN